MQSAVPAGSLRAVVDCSHSPVVVTAEDIPNSLADCICIQYANLGMMRAVITRLTRIVVEAGSLVEGERSSAEEARNLAGAVDSHYAAVLGREKRT